MKQTFRLLIIASLMAVVLSGFSPAASAKAKEVELLTGTTAAVMAGADAWLAINWTAEENVSNFRVVLDSAPEGVQVGYPSNLGSWTGLHNGHFLDEDEIDFTALEVSIPSSFTKKTAKLKLLVSYDFEGETQSGTFNVKVPVTQFSGGADLSQTTDAASVGSAGWVSVSFAGHAPKSEAFTMVVTDQAGLPIVYPSYGTATSLHSDNVLSAGESDSARFFVDAEGMSAGDYTVAIEVTYDAGSGPTTIPGSVVISVTP